MSKIGPTKLINSMAEQLDAVIERHQQGGDSVIVTLNGGVSVTGLKTYSIAQADPELGYQRKNKTCQVRFAVSQLKGAQFGQDFDVGDVCYVNDPIIQPNYTNQKQDQNKWELLYFRVSEDGLMATVGLKSND